MPRIARIACAAVMALALASCSSEPDDYSVAESSTGDDDSSSTEEDSGSSGDETSVLEGLSGDAMCDLLSTETIEQELGVGVTGSEGTERGRAPEMLSPYFLTRECAYDTEGFPSVNTDLTTKWDEGTSDDEVIDGVFTNDVSEEVGDYEEVPDLGDVAGFGADAMLAGAEVAGRDLGVVLHFGEERVLATVSTTGKATLEELRPLAEELITNLESAINE